jgi:hypothetical protein
MFGVQVPKSNKQALELDKINKNNLWELALQKEVGQLGDYDTFENFGYDANAPDGYKRIRAHVIYSVKHDGRRKCLCVAEGHLTYPVMVSELNEIKTTVGDIRNA